MHKEIYTEGNKCIQKPTITLKMPLLATKRQLPATKRATACNEEPYNYTPHAI
jgi:hypothetical protein